MKNNWIIILVLVIVIIAAVLYLIGYFMRKKNQEQLDDYIQRLNKEFEIEFYELFSKNTNENDEEIEIKLNKEKQKLIRLVAVKNDKKFSKSSKENYKIGAIISNQQ